MKRNFFFILSILIIGFPAIATADVDAMMQGCNDCHGDNGVSQSSDVPTIAGLAEFVHVDALYIYQDEARPCADSEYRQGDTSRAATSMCAIAAELSEDDIDAIAAAYADQPLARRCMTSIAIVAIPKQARLPTTKPACWVVSRWVICAT